MGELSREELSQLFGGMWQAELIRNQLILPRLLERCPEVDARVQLWRVIYPAYGRGNFPKSHPFLFRAFLLAIGLKEDELSWELDTSLPRIRLAMDDINAKPWIDLLIGGLLGTQLVTVKLYEQIANALQSYYGLHSSELGYFLAQHQEGSANTEILFTLAARYCSTAGQQELALHVLGESISQVDLKMSFCELGTSAYRFVRSPEGLPRSIDRRRGVRLPLELRVRIHSVISGPSEAITQDVSTRGMLLRTQEQRQVGSAIDLSVTHPVTGDQIELPGHVVRVVYGVDGKQLGLGIEFDPEDFLNRQLGRFFKSGEYP